MCSTHTPTLPDNNGLSKNLHNNPFLPGFSSFPGWLLVTRTRGDWWCRYRGHCRSGPRHLSPRSRVCAQEWHSKHIHSHIHSHPPMHTPKTRSRTINSPNMTPSCRCPFPAQCCGRRQPRSLADAPQDCSTSEALSPRTVLTDIFLHGPESAHKNGIVKTFTPTATPIHPFTLLKKEKEKKNAQLTKHDAFVYWSSSCPLWWWATARKLGACSSWLPTSESFSPRTVLTGNICRCVQHIFQHRPTTMPFLITSKITLSGLASIVQNLQ